MSTSDFQIDYKAARGSNTGDEYHELWAVRQALRLLGSDSQLSAITVEGLTVQEGTETIWDGVDCSLFFGGTNASDADRVEIQQLKYSASNPASSWTVARLSSGKDGTPKTSPIRRLANAFKGLITIRPDKPVDTLQICLVSNQPVASDLLALIEEALNPIPSSYSKAWKPGMPDLHRLVHASGLKPAQFREFARVLDLQGASGSRFAIEDGMLKAISEWTDVELRESANRLREYVRKRMLPEAAGELITRERILVQFSGVSDDYALFPCPSRITPVASAVPRAISSEVVEHIKAGVQHICLHGIGGVGKTTTLQQIEQQLPDGSLMVVFDCYGGGSYQDASALRHRPQDAFVQLTNEIAHRLRLPLLLVPSATRDYPRTFRKRLELAAAAMSKSAPDGLLVIAIDAADNSVFAAQTRTPEEVSFVHDLVTFDQLPVNVRLLVSARTGRLDDLQLAKSFRKFPLPVFDRQETQSNVARFWCAPHSWVDDFHHLSSGLPRVQAYAFQNAATDPEHAIDALRPLGKNLDQVFHEQFTFALSKNARESDLENVCAGLIALPRPIPLIDLAAVLGAREATISDICADLAPGVRNTDGLLSFADEDFEAFVREAGKSAIAGVRARAADHFLAHAKSDPYAALNIAPALLAAGRRKALLELVESEPEPAAETMPDPIRRREVQVQRLQAAIRVCREAEDPSRALRFVLIGAEAIRTEEATLKLLVDNPGLTARYAKDTASRLILGDPNRIEAHGPLLFHMLAEDAARGDAISVREGRRRLNAWEHARWDDYEEKRKQYDHASAWRISPDDVAAAMYARLLIDGPPSAVALFRRVPSRGLAYLAGKFLVDRLLAESKAELVERVADHLTDAHALFLLVPLASSGHAVDQQRLASGLRQLRRRSDLNPSLLVRSSTGDKIGPWIIDTVLSAAEILVAKDGDKDIVAKVLAPFLEPEVRRIDKLHSSQYLLLDAIFRAVSLSHALVGTPTTSDQLLLPRPKPPESNRPSHTHNSRTNERDRELDELASAFGELYIARARLFACSTRDAAADTDLLVQARGRLERDSWSLDRRHGTFSMRAKAAESLQLLIAANMTPRPVLESALAVRRGWSPQSVHTFYIRFAAVTSLHDMLVEGITREAESVRSQRTTAEERSDALTTYARLIATVSPSDADAVFKWAIDVAAELDSEIMDQLRLIAKLVKQCHAQMGTDRRTPALDLSEVIRDAAIRLANYDHFPWDAAVSALSLLDYPLALAAAARWDDAEVASLSQTLGDLIDTGLEAGQLSVGQAAAIAGLLQNIDGNVLLKICEIAECDDDEIAGSIVEEFARDKLLDRINDGTPLIPVTSRHRSRYWAQRLVEQREFKKKLSATAVKAAEYDKSPGTENDDSGSGLHIWPEAALIDPEQLGSEARRLMEQSRQSKRFLPINASLLEAGKQVPVRHRVAHLDALVALDQSWDDDDVIQAVFSRLEEWASGPAVAQWRNQYLPELLSIRLPALCRYLPYHDRKLKSALALLEASGAPVQDVLLHGIERNIDYLGAAAAFSLTGVIASQLEPKNVAELCNWYIARLAGRVKTKDRENIPGIALPATVDEALGRFFYAYLSDIDVRKRWRCVHALRRLARLQAAGTLSAVIDQYQRREEPAFREGGTPFYWVAARLWLVIAMDRIALESPHAADRHGAWLLEVALDDEFPHLLIREFARDGCLKLIGSGHLSPSAGADAALRKVNKSSLPRSTEERGYGNTFDGFDRHESNRRFRFNGMDTLRYWYNPVLRAFSDVTPEEFLQTAEHWIVDRWGFNKSGSSAIQDPRRHRFNDRDWNLYSNSHGSNPTLEDLRSYLEWHSMWCAAGQLLRTRPLSISRYGDDDDDYADLSRYNKLTVPPLWLADVAGPPPLQKNRWSAPPDIVRWLEGVSDDGFVAEALPCDAPNYVVVSASINDRSSGHHETVRISSGLVSPNTAHALVRALQTVKYSHDFYICPEGHECEINESGFKLTGWLVSHDGDSRLDEKDIFSNGIRRIEFSPGKAVSSQLGLEYQIGSGTCWFRHNQIAPSFIYEAWGFQENERDWERSYGENPESSGYRLLMRKQDLSEFLSKKKRDLIVEVEIIRREQRRPGYSNDEKEPTENEFERLLLFRRDGSVQAAERDFGSWR